MDREQKIETVVSNLEKGDAHGVQQVLNTITDRTDQNIYMQRFASRMNQADACLKLHECKVADLDNDGSPEAIRMKSITIAKVDTADGQRLKAIDSSPKLRDIVVDYATRKVGDASVGLQNWWNESPLGSAIHRAAGPDSEMNRRWERLETNIVPPRKDR